MTTAWAWPVPFTRARSRASLSWEGYDITWPVLTAQGEDERDRDKSTWQCLIRQGTSAEVNAHSGIFRFSAYQLLAVLTLLLVSAPVVQTLPYARPVEAALLTLVLLSAVLAVGGRRKMLAIAILLVSPALLVLWLEHSDSRIVPIGSGMVAAMLPLGFTIVVLLRFVLISKRVTGEVLCAAVSNYLMIGLLWSMAYRLVELLSPCAFRSGSSGGDIHMLGLTPVYFSFVTLCTVGYGDIYPASDTARMLALMEAMTGTFYIAVLIARLVALYSTERSDRPG